MDLMEVLATIASIISVVALTASIMTMHYQRVSSNEQRRTRLDDKFPCIVVRSRKNRSIYEVRLVNIGKGPAFITQFEVKGLDRLHSDHEYKDGDHTDEIDRALGPEVGDPALQCWFAWGSPKQLRAETVSIGIAYTDIEHREFRSGIIRGKPVWKPPQDFYNSDYERTKEEMDLIEELRVFLAEGKARSSTGNKDNTA